MDFGQLLMGYGALALLASFTVFKAVGIYNPAADLETRSLSAVLIGTAVLSHVYMRMIDRSKKTAQPNLASGVES